MKIRKGRLTLCILLLSALLLHNFGFCQETEKDQTNKTLSPYFMVEGDDSSVDVFPLKDTRVEVNITGVLADIRVTQVYTNTGAKPINATYVFPASTRATVHGMKMTLGDKIITAKIEEKQKAREVFEEAKSEGKTASLLEEQMPNVFTMNLANIMPQDTMELELHYTELITPTDGTYQFVFPTVVGPRYSSQSAANAPDEDRFVASPYLHEGETPPGSYNISVHLSAGIPVQNLKSSSHSVNIDWTDETTATVTLANPTEYAGNRDYILSYGLMGDAIQSGLTLYRAEKENYFMLMVQPPERVVLEDIPPREYIFVLDVSGSMIGYPLDTAKIVVRDLIGNLRPEDKFNIILFSGNSFIMSNTSIPANAENILKAINLINDQQGGGGTELSQALTQAVSLPKEESYSRSVLIVTDGYIDGEKEIYDIISQNLNNTNFFSFGIGSSVNRFLIEGIAKIGLGEPFVVTNPEDAAQTARLFSDYVKSPVLTNIQVSFDGFEAYDVEPENLPALFAQRPLVVLGKWKGEPAGTIRITGKTGSGDYNHELTVSQDILSESNSALRYLWARSKVERLTFYEASYHDQALIEQITALGLEYSMMTPYTSFVAVLETIRNTQGPATDVDQANPLPQGVTDYAVGDNPQSGDGGVWLEIVLLCVGAAGMAIIAISSKKQRAFAAL